MGAAVHDVHHGHGEDLGVGAADVFVEGLAEGVGGGVGGGEGDAEDGVGAELRLVLGAIDLDHQVVDADLVAGVGADEDGSDDGLHVADGGEHALAEEAGLAVDALGQGFGGDIGVAELVGLVFAGGGAGGNGSAAEGAVGETDVHLDGGITAGVDDLAGADAGDGGVAHVVMKLRSPLGREARERSGRRETREAQSGRREVSGRKCAQKIPAGRGGERGGRALRRGGGNPHFFFTPRAAPMRARRPVSRGRRWLGSCSIWPRWPAISSGVAPA